MIPYVLHVALLLAICLLFYKLLLQKETYYSLNRAVLIGCLAMAFLLPLIKVPQQWALRDSPVVSTAKPSSPTVAARSPQVTPVVSDKPQLQNAPTVKAEPIAEPQLPLMQRIIKWAVYLYWFGVAAFGANLLLQLCVLAYQSYRKPVIQDGAFRIVELDDDKAPCSFGNSIYINPSKYEPETFNQILLHEKVHIKQRHSVDLMLAELMLAFQWFNPFAWLYRKEVESNLEYLADNEVLHDTTVERSDYQMNLLKVSVPNMSLRITTNYNQSLLKKRIVMMNAKKSNIHTAWKYLFLVPMMAFLVCALNEPAVSSVKLDINTMDAQATKPGTGDEGSWKATITGNKMELKLYEGDEDQNHMSNSSFLVSEFTALPIGQDGAFKLVREAGTMQFTGRFDGSKGAGKYKFTRDAAYFTFLKGEGISGVSHDDEMAFFFLNINKNYVTMLKNNGYKTSSKDDVIACSALGVDEPYIRAMKQNGYPNITLQELITGRAMGINGAFIADIRKAGYPKVDWDKLVSFKAQGIDGKYISKFRAANKKPGVVRADASSDDIIAFKALNVDDAYINALKKEGYANLQAGTLTSMKAVGVDGAFIHGFKAAGYNNISADNLISLKSLGITPEFMASFKAAGYKQLSVDQASSLKALGITPEYLNGFKDAGYGNISVDNASGLKALGITPEYLKGFKAIGFNVSLDEATGLKAMGITPEYITQMKEKGFKSDDINKYITLKAAF